jgi:hypothetical protein
VVVTVVSASDAGIRSGIPAGQNYVLVEYGEEYGQTRHPLGLTITVARQHSSGLFALNREISVCARLRGGVERTRTSNQAVIVKRWAKHSATILTTSTTASRKSARRKYLSGKLSGRCLGDQLSIGRSGRI